MKYNNKQNVDVILKLVLKRNNLEWVKLKSNKEESSCTLWHNLKWELQRERNKFFKRFPLNNNKNSDNSDENNIGSYDSNSNSNNNTDDY